MTRKRKKHKNKKNNMVYHPFSMNVATNILVLNECSPKNNKLHDIFKRNTIKLSYSCMTNRK